MTASYDCLRNHFLISMPHLNDFNFSHTVIYLCDHSEYGALGLIINRPVGLTLTELCNHLNLPCPCPSQPNQQTNIFSGGPLHNDRGYVLHQVDTPLAWTDSHLITNNIYLSTSIQAIEAAAAGQFAQNYLIALGCASWGPNQLEEEMINNVWLSCPANSDILFSTPAKERLQAAASVLGVNLDRLSNHSGHA